MAGRAFQSGRHRYTRFVGGPSGPFVRAISEVTLDLSKPPQFGKVRRPAPYIVKTPLMGGSLIYSWVSDANDCTTAEFNKLQCVGRLEGRDHALTAYVWTRLNLIDALTAEEVKDALVGRIRGDYHLSPSAYEFDVFGKGKQTQTVSLQFASDLIFAKMALFG